MSQSLEDRAKELAHGLWMSEEWAGWFHFVEFAQEYANERLCEVAAILRPVKAEMDEYCLYCERVGPSDVHGDHCPGDKIGAVLDLIERKQ